MLYIYPNSNKGTAVIKDLYNQERNDQYIKVEIPISPMILHAKQKEIAWELLPLGAPELVSLNSWAKHLKG